jgi:serum/glucocorticoid-regulated kinase 2
VSAFFAEMASWDHLLILESRLLAKKIQPPFKPSVVCVPYRYNRYYQHVSHISLSPFPQESVLDVANFDPDFTNEEAQDSVVEDSHLSETVQDQFK